MPFGLAPAAIQQLMPNTMRGQASSLYLFVINLIGLGLGPTVVATLTQDVFHDKNAVASLLAGHGRVRSRLRHRVALVRAEALPPQPRILERVGQSKRVNAKPNQSSFVCVA